MRCSNCGHEPHQHDNGGQCHVTVLTGWSEATKHFTGERPCGCTQYTGQYQPNNCPHEVVGNSHQCVHCGAAREPIRDT